METEAAQAGAAAPATDGSHAADAAASDGWAPSRSIGFTLSTLGFAVSAAFREKLAPLGLEPRDFALLRAIGGAEGASQQAVGAQLGIPPSRMVAFVDALEARGLVERRPQPADRRARALHLTAAGRALQRRAFAVAAAFEQELSSGLRGGEPERLRELLGRVGETLGLAPGVHAAHKHAPQDCP